MTTVAGPVRTEPRARLRDLVRAEWLKLWSLRSTYWAAATVAAVAAGSATDAALADYRNWPGYPADMRSFFTPLPDAFPRAAWYLIMVVAGSIGAVALAGEYSSGLIRTTFAAVPARRAVVAAKVIAMTAAMTALGAVSAVSSFALSQAILSGRHVGWPVGHPGALPALAASSLLVPVCALVGMGIGAVVRHTAPTVVTTAATLTLLPAFFDGSRRWQQDVQHAMPLPAWERLVDGHPEFLAHQRYPATVAGSWITYAAWAVVAVALATVVVHRRDP